MPQNTTIRIAKFLARAGIASRRKSEALVEAGRVSINGKIVTTPATNIDLERDDIRLDGRRVETEPHVYLVLNKPPGYTCSASDPHAERLVAELYPPGMPRLFTVGRLDRDSEGLILCTNDGDFAQRIAHPRHEIPKEYHVQVEGRVKAASLKTLVTQGIEDDGEHLQATRAVILKTVPGGALLHIILNEGKNREIRRMCEHFGWRVRRLRRVAIGPLKLDNLPPGQTRPLTPNEHRALIT